MFAQAAAGRHGRGGPARGRRNGRRRGRRRRGRRSDARTSKKQRRKQLAGDAAARFARRPRGGADFPPPDRDYRARDLARRSRLCGVLEADEREHMRAAKRSAKETALGSTPQVRRGGPLGRGRAGVRSVGRRVLDDPSAHLACWHLAFKTPVARRRDQNHLGLAGSR